MANIVNKQFLISNIKEEPHHKQQSLCTSRPAYRQGRKLTAIKVYTVNDESKYLIISGVQNIKISDELSKMCLKFGQIQFIYPLPEYPSNEFELAYVVHYSFIRNARVAKRHLDGKSFFGNVLHVCYAPELESIEETKEKLIERRKNVAYHSNRSNKTNKKISTNKKSKNESDSFSNIPTNLDKLKQTLLHKNYIISPLSNDLHNKNDNGHNSQLEYKKIKVDTNINNITTSQSPVDKSFKNGERSQISSSLLTHKKQRNFKPMKIKSSKFPTPYFQPCMESLKKSAKNLDCIP